jgi:hypothetical protein
MVIGNSHEDSTIHFYKSQLSEGILDSLNDLATSYVDDKSFLDQDPNGTYDSYYILCLSIEMEDKNALIEFLDSHSIPDDLKPIVSDFWKLGQGSIQSKWHLINFIRSKRSWMEFYLSDQDFCPHRSKALSNLLHLRLTQSRSSSS